MDKILLILKKIGGVLIPILIAIGTRVRALFLKIFPRRAAKYFDADLHEMKYIGLMALYALGINLYIEVFARLTTSPIAGIVWAVTHPLVFLFNTIIIFASMTLALLFKKRRFAWMMISIVWVLLGGANGVLLLQRITPFTLYDLANTAEGLTLMHSYYASWQITLIFTALGLGAFLIVLIFIRSQKWTNINYKKSIVAIILSLAMAGGATWGAISTGLVGTYFGNLGYAYRDYGFVYGFLSTSLSAGISKPRGYSEEMIENILAKKTDGGTNKVIKQTDDNQEHPNIIVLQMESFTTANSYKHFTVDKDPTPVFNRLKKEYTSGYFTVPACGAGTANTEFEVLTGMSAKFFGPGEYPYKGKLREQTLESMAYIAKRHGYATAALHDHRALFYNRNEVYANMGFDSYTSVEYMNSVSFTPTNWCKDENLISEISEIMKESKSRDMLHVVSVEGHGKYPTEQVFSDPYTTITMKDGFDNENNELKWKFEYYVNECHEMDTFIGNLLKEINKLDEPTVVLIYGDHIPALDVTEEMYAAPDLYTTEYVIWDNFGLTRKDKDTTSWQVGADVLAAAGLKNEGVIFDYQQSNNEKTDKSYLDDLEALAYDIMYGKYYAFGGKNPYEPVDMKMGHKQIKIKEIIKIGDRYYIKGKNFTARSVISLEGKTLSTTYLSPTLLALNEKVEPDDIKKLAVSQVDKSDSEILTTVGANEEL